MDIDAVIAKNVEKYNKKLEKGGSLTQNIARLANTNTANIDNNKTSKPSANLSKEEREAQIKKATEYLNKTNNNKKSGSSGGSLASKANMVKDYNERNNK
jgi:YidC/Oxa1 family membrane protein insertase